VTGLAAHAAACLGAFGILGLAILPPEHVHLGDHDDHARAEVHRHYQPHQPTAIQTHVEPPDQDATYLSDAFIVPAPVSTDAPEESPSALIAPLDLQPRHAVWQPAGRDLRAHDPPWARAHALRGPPSQLA
jgi:hypothetical protein